MSGPSDLKSIENPAKEHINYPPRLIGMNEWTKVVLPVVSFRIVTPTQKYFRPTEYR